MTEDPRADLVARQYAKWQYPQPIENLEAHLANNWDWFDPRNAHRVYWPDRPYRAEMDIIVAGCGTNQAPLIAYTNPASRVVGIDISQESLDHGRYLKHKHNLSNLELNRLPIEEVHTLGRSFDLVISSGVLHHMASPQAGMDALAGVLRPDGVAAIMLYARYGRLGVEGMQSVFRSLGLSQDEESLPLVRAALDWLAPSHPARVYMTTAPDLAYDAGIVDTFLHGRDVSFTVSGCLDLVERSGLVFQDWLFKNQYHPPVLTEPDNPFLAAVNALPRPQMWEVMEPTRNFNGCHLFLACRPERSQRSYLIDFTGSDVLDYVPLWRFRAGLEGHTVVEHGWSITLGFIYVALVEQVDGERSIREIVAQAARSDAVAGISESDLQDHAVHLFEHLWRTDFVAVDLGRLTPSQ